MEKSSSIFNSKKMPTGFLWLIVFFILFELLMRLLWNPGLTGETLYPLFSKLDPTYSYGYNYNKPLFYNSDSRLVCYPSQYDDIFKQYLNKQKLENEFRIFVIGASVSRGDAYERNYSYFLEKSLRHRVRDKIWTVLNLSASGFGSQRMLLRLGKTIAYKPDLLIVHVHGSNEYEDERDRAYKNAVNTGVNKILFSSYLVVILKKIYVHALGPEKFVSFQMDDEGAAIKKEENWQRWNDIMRNNLAEMASITRKHGIPLILMGRTENNSYSEGFESPRAIVINNIIKSFCYKDNIFYFNTPAIIANRTASERKAIFFTDETHWTAEGHQFIAKELTDYIIKVVNKGYN